MTTLLPVSVVIPTRNRPQSLRSTLASISAGVELPREIIVIDQSDLPLESVDLSTELGHGILLQMVRQALPSSTIARNTGIRLARQDIILFMDDDILLDRYSVSELFKSFADDRVALVAAPHQGNTPNSRRHPDVLGSAFLRKKPFRSDGYVCRGAVLGRYPSNLRKPVPTEWAMGFFFAVRRSLLEAYQVKFDENLLSYAYAEDLDFSYTFCVQAKAQGYRCILNPRVFVNHVGSHEWKMPDDRATMMYVVHRGYLSYKHFGSPLNRVILIWSDVGEVLRRMLARLDWYSVLRGYLLLYRHRHAIRKGSIPRNVQDTIGRSG